MSPECRRVSQHDRSNRRSLLQNKLHILCKRGSSWAGSPSRSAAGGAATLTPVQYDKIAQSLGHDRLEASHPSHQGEKRANRGMTEQQRSPGEPISGLDLDLAQTMGWGNGRGPTAAAQGLRLPLLTLVGRCCLSYRFSIRPVLLRLLGVRDEPHAPSVTK